MLQEKFEQKAGSAGNNEFAVIAELSGHAWAKSYLGTVPYC
jgi:hypothetical protein